MKSFIALCSLAVFICVFVGSLEAKPELRQKRALYQENCPDKMTHEQCKTWADEEHKKKNECIRHEVLGTSIEWAGCGSINCGDNGREVPIASDLTKPYPDCCPSCEAIDPSKPAMFTRIG